MSGAFYCRSELTACWGLTVPRVPGHETVLTRLGDVLTIQAIRSWFQAHPARCKGWLGALKDPQIGRAVALVHRDPGHAWTLAELAEQLGYQSEAAFSRAFKRVVAVSPGAVRRNGKDGARAP